MLKPDERLSVIDTLTTVLAAGSVKVFVPTYFGDAADALLRSLGADVTLPGEQATFIVRQCLRSRWRLTPSLMQRLLDALVVLGHGALAVQRDRVIRREDPNPDPTLSEWVRSELPFFGRPALRPLLRQLMDGDDKPILLIHGPEDSGMTYTKEIIGYLAHQNKDQFHVSYAYLEKGSTTIPPDELAETLVTPMKARIEDIPKRTPHRYEKRLCNWILNQALRTSDNWWLVLDGFGALEKDDETAALVQELAVKILDTEFSSSVRLVLIDYQARPANIHPAKIAEDTLPPPETITHADLETCLWQHFKDVGENPEPSFVQGLATELLAEAAAQKEPRLKYLNDRIYAMRQTGLRKVGRI